jgi:hypothetical protein
VDLIDVDKLGRDKLKNIDKIDPKMTTYKWPKIGAKKWSKFIVKNGVKIDPKLTAKNSFIIDAMGGV